MDTDKIFTHAEAQRPRRGKALKTERRNRLLTLTLSSVEEEMVKQSQSPQKLLRAVANEGSNLGRTEKTMPVNQPDDFAVALRQFYRSNRGGTPETGKTEKLHRSTISKSKKAKKESGFAAWDKFRASTFTTPLLTFLLTVSFTVASKEIRKRARPNLALGFTFLQLADGSTAIHSGSEEGRIFMGLLRIMASMRGTLAGAGGVGGLLMINKRDTTAWRESPHYLSVDKPLCYSVMKI